jgi:hypothetical protein
MGWLYTNVGKGQAGAYFKDAFKGETDQVKIEVIQGAFVGWKEYYCAVKRTHKDTGESYVFAVACMVNYCPKSYHNFGYKDMDESMGPYMYNCPESILKLLTPSEEMARISGSKSTTSKAWRIACWEKVIESKMVAKLEDGAIIKFPNKLLFGTGEAVDTFVMRRHGKQKRFYLYDAIANKAVNTYHWYRLRKRDLGKFSVIGKVAVNA